MDLTLIINFIINQLLSHDSNSNNTNNAIHNHFPPQNLDETPGENAQNKLKEISNNQSVRVVLTFCKELGELVKRFFSNDYLKSRNYENKSKVRNDGKVAVITDGDNGIGAEVALHLIESGFKVIIGMKVEKVDRSLPVPTEVSNNSRFVKLNISSLESVREFAKEVTESETKIDLLINCADVYEYKKIITRDGFEKNFQDNYLGHFLLTNLLISNLKKSTNGRIVNITSFVHYFGHINFDDINNEKLYIPFQAYAQSKLANVLFTRELAKRLMDTYISVYVVSPEMIREPEIVKKNQFFKEMFSRISDPKYSSQTVLYVSLDESLKNESGFYYSNLQKLHPLPSNSSDEIVAEKLWTLSEKWVNLDKEKELSSEQNEGQDIKQV